MKFGMRDFSCRAIKDFDRPTYRGAMGNRKKCCPLAFLPAKYLSTYVSICFTSLQFHVRADTNFAGR